MRLLVLALSLLVALPAVAQTTQADLYLVKASAERYAPLTSALIADADKALLQKPLSVLDKKKGLEGADPHDYVSYAPYFWPNPATPSGLPFIRKDGQRNREQVALGDENNAGVIKRAITTLGLAYNLTSKEAYAVHAQRLVRTWFLDPATRMNPNLDHGQAVPGGVLGRKEGVIEWRDLTGMLFALRQLELSPTWTDADKAGMKAWLSDYYTWLTTSKIGLAEKKATNNHGCWYDVQAIALALHLEKTQEARALAEGFKAQRIDRQLVPDGRQPGELDRADSWGYSTFNLAALFQMADYARLVGVDLWGYKSADGRSLRAALDYLLPFADGTKPWPHENDPTHKVDAAKLLLPLLRAGSGFKDPALTERAKALAGKNWETLRERLLINPR